MNKYIEHIYLINMDKDNNRLKNVTNHCNELNIKFKRFPGINPKYLSQKEKDKYLIKLYQYFMPFGVIGAAYSHIYIWLDAIKNNYKNILILEDDVCFKKENFYEKFQNAFNELPNNYDMFFMGYTFGDNYNERIKDFKYIYKPKNIFYDLHSYIVSLEGCKKLIEIIKNNKVNYPIDYIITENRNLLNIYLINNVITFQDKNFKSNIVSHYFPFFKYTYEYNLNFYLFRIGNLHFNKLDIICLILSFIINSNLNYIISIILLLIIIFNTSISCILCYIIGLIISIN